MIRARDGRLCSYGFAPGGDAVVRRTELSPDGPWSESATVGGEQRLHPVLGLAQGPGGYVHLASWRPTVPGESGLVHSTHFQPHLSALDWTPIGHPNKTGDRTGPPAVAVDAQGRAHVFVRNKGGGISMRAQREKGGWAPWRDLAGTGVRGELAAVADESGLISVYAATPDGILRRRQQSAGTALVPDDKPLPANPRPDTLRALATSAEHTTLFYTDEDGGLYAWRGEADPVRLMNAAGPGPVAAIRCRLDDVDCTLLAQRADSGRVAFAAYPTELESAGAWWTESGPALPPDTQIALAEDANGRVVAATYTPGAPPRLALTRRKNEPGLALEAWRPIP
nr:hypothetical protein [Streptomyces sp. SID5785]